MKNILLFILLSICPSCFAGVTFMQVDYVSSSQYNVVAYGILPNGEPSYFQLKSDPDIAKVNAIYDVPMFGISSQVNRSLYFFNTSDSTINRCEFQWFSPFSTKSYPQLGSFNGAATTAIGNLRILIESK